MNKRMVFSGVVLLLALAVAGCSFAAPTPMSMDGAEAPARQGVVEESYAPAPGGEAESLDSDTYGGDDVSERLIIRNASLDLVVSNTEDALGEINAVVEELGGYVVESSAYQVGESKRASIQLRVPAESLDQALDRFRDLATEVQRESVSGQDVTDEYVDLQSSLRHKEAVEEKLLEFLEDAEDTEASLAVYAELSQIQAEIEYVKGRIQYLEQSAAMSSVTISLTPDELAQPIEVGGWHPEGTLKDSIEAFIRVLQFLVEALIVIVTLILPTALVILGPLVVLFLIVRAIVRRRRARKTD